MHHFSIILLVLLHLPFGLLAQENPLQQEINDQVWKPFMKTYETLDAEGFMDLHTEDVLRVNRDGEKIQIGQEYHDQITKSYTWMRENKVHHSIQFSFVQRIANSTHAYEVGYYKGVSERPGKDPRTFYGKFHVTLKKIDGIWKIAVDSDTSYGQTIGEVEFLSGESME